MLAVYFQRLKENKLDPKKQYILCSNHPSTLDIVMMFALSKKPISFIGKHSLSKIPIFGYYYKSFNVLVDRSNLRNSYLAYQEAGKKLTQGQNMVIYPEGGIPKEDIRLFLGSKRVHFVWQLKSKFQSFLLPLQTIRVYFQ